MLLIANRQLTGDYGLVPPEGVFEADEKTAYSLMERNLARFADPMLYETKVITPETKEGAEEPSDPFRDVFARYSEQAAMAAASHSVLPVADVPEPRVTDRGERTKRKASSARR